VTLRGTVANAAQRRKAEDVACGIEGVKNVRSQLTITASGGNAK
jgi:osmotically-inducible protein OsmY